MSAPKNPIEPRCKSLALCDRAIIEEGTKKISLINIFSEISFPEFPAESPSFTLFAQFTDAVGRYEIVFEIRDLARDAVILKSPPEVVEIGDRLGNFNLLMPFSPIPFPRSGAYDVVIVVDGHDWEHLRIIATSFEED